ncbi:MAG: hypothetical protein WC119_01665 [Synergistaceae bacterium]
MGKKSKVESLMKDPVCHKWLSFSTAVDSDQPAEWFKEKQTFWEENQEHLKSFGFEYASNIGRALDTVEIMKEDDLEGSLLVVKVGNSERPASPDDINLAHKMLNDVLDGVKGIRVVVTHHAFDITKISLPQIRSLQSAILASTDPSEDINPIVDLDL